MAFVDELYLYQGRKIDGDMMWSHGLPSKPRYAETRKLFIGGLGSFLIANV